MNAPEFEGQLELAATPDEKTLDTVPSGNGVFLFRDHDEKPLMLGVAANLRAALRAKLFEQSDNPLDKKRVKLAGVANRVSWTRTVNEFERFLVYWMLAKQLYPKTFRSMLPFSQCWFITVDLQSAIPKFESKKTPSPNAEHVFGPLARRRDAEQMIRLLEDAFDLCRYYDVLLQAPKGQACAYFDMGRCPAPCDGSVSMASYQQSVEAALAFLRRDQNALSPVEARMKAAAANTNFELAGVYKKIGSEAREIFYKPAFAHVCFLNDSAWLVVLLKHSRKKRTHNAVLRAFGFCGGDVRALSDGKYVDLDDLTNQWRDEVMHQKQDASLNSVDAAISTALLNRYLNKPDQRMVVIIPDKRIDSDWIRSEIKKRLLMPTK